MRPAPTHETAQLLLAAEKEMTAAGEWVVFLVLFFLGLVNFLYGLATYRGDTGGTLDRGTTGRPALASAYLGLALMMMAGIPWVLAVDSDLLLVPFVLVMFSSLIIGLVGWIWMPKILWPKWMKDKHREARELRRMLKKQR